MILHFHQYLIRILIERSFLTKKSKQTQKIEFAYFFRNSL